MFNNTIINLNNDENNKRCIKDVFFSKRLLIKKYNIPYEYFNIKINFSSLHNLFKIKSNLIFDDDDLLIHIRSGDVFSSNPHSGWIQPPLIFYKNIIDNYNWNKIYLVSEDKKNPVTNILLQLYPNIYFKIQSLENDIKLIIACKNICFGMGSFIPSLLLFNNIIKNIYYPEYCHRYLIDYTNCTKNIIKLPNYIKKGEWKNTKKQQDIMLNYVI